MKFNKIIETCIYSSDLEEEKKFYTQILKLELVSEEKGRSLFFKVGKSMLLVFNPEKTMKPFDVFPAHGITIPPSTIHFAIEINRQDYDEVKSLIVKSDIKIESELTWPGGAFSLYFRDPSGNLVEIITNGVWPVED